MKYQIVIIIHCISKISKKILCWNRKNLKCLNWENKSYSRGSLRKRQYKKLPQRSYFTHYNWYTMFKVILWIQPKSWMVLIVVIKILMKIPYHGDIQKVVSVKFISTRDILLMVLLVCDGVTLIKVLISMQGLHTALKKRHHLFLQGDIISICFIG